MPIGKEKISLLGNEYERKSMIRHSKWDVLTVFLHSFKIDIQFATLMIALVIPMRKKKVSFFEFNIISR